MAIRDLIGPGVGLASAQVSFVVTRGLGNFTAPPSSEGLQWTIPESKVHYACPENRVHYTVSQ